MLHERPCIISRDSAAEWGGSWGSSGTDEVEELASADTQGPLQCLNFASSTLALLLTVVFGAP